MRKLPGVLVLLGALVFVLGALRTLLGHSVFGYGIFAVPGETYWRAATFAVLLAMALMMLARHRQDG